MDKQMKLKITTDGIEIEYEGDCAVLALLFEEARAMAEIRRPDATDQDEDGENG